MPTRAKPKSPAPTTALCYVRLSMTRDEADLNSPERQKANIQAECDRRGWTAEWYEDTDGHKSGTKEENRPGWLALKGRLGDPDVVAVVANDLSRLHRKGWRIGSLIDFLEEHQVSLVLAAPGRNLDLSGPAGKISTMVIALMDEYYASDTSEKQKDSVRYRRSKGIIVGGIPFGTMRDNDGYLQASSRGAWLLPDGNVVKGERTDPPPDPAAIWRGFVDAARRCLELYAENRFGRRRIADMLNLEGYRYQDVHGDLDLFAPDDIRRIAANWIEYGGTVLNGRARGRRARDVTPDTVTLNPERAIFDVALCSKVGEVRQQRTRDIRRLPENAVRLDAQVYPLTKLVYCAHCERLAADADNTALRSHLTGKTGSKKESRRYRHDTERKCPAHRRSVDAELLERDFLLLLQCLSVKPEALPILAEAIEHFNRQNQQGDSPTLIQTEIAHWRQRAQNADKLFARARIGEPEWRQMLDEAEHEIARLQSQVAQQHEAEIALRLTMDMVANLVENWNEANGENRRSFAFDLFEYLVYDLDQQQITGFKLKPWIELLMQLKVTLGHESGHEAGNTDSDEGGNNGVLWCTRRDSNPRRQVPKTCALTAELRVPVPHYSRRPFRSPAPTISTREMC